MNDASVPQRPPVIRTPDQRLRVFISSTLKEMVKERQAASRAISQLRLSPVMFELGARPHQAQDLYRAYLEQSHIFLGIYGEEYGWVAPGKEISGLEEEYNLATDKPKLIYITKPAPKRDARLQQMLWSIRDRDGISYKYFSSPEELEELIGNDLALLLTERFESAIPLPPASGTIKEQVSLPHPPTPIIGRQAPLNMAKRFLIEEKKRLLTLTGPGGSGKTRLSIEIAGEVSPLFDIVCFINMAALTDPGLVATNIAQSLGIREAGAKPADALLVDYLLKKKALLVLDNFEQITPAAPLLARLLESCAELTLLVTSRIALNLRGEQELEVLPLPVPVSAQKLKPEILTQYASVQLFCQRAQAVEPGFILDKDTAPIVAEICRRLEGLPLAIELAAARSRLLAPVAMLARLEKRLPVLTGGARDLPERQQTMRNTIAWSYELLDDGASVLFRRLSVFAGGCTLEAAETVANHDQALKADMLEIMDDLVSQSLLRISYPAGGAEMRFEMLETIREYAREKLEEEGEQAALERVHADYFAALAETAEPYYRGSGRTIWLDRIEAELDNIRAVFRHSLDGDIPPDAGLRLAGTIGWFSHLHGHLSEGRSWAESMLTLAPATSPLNLRARILFPAGGLAWSQSDYKASIRFLNEAVSIFRKTGDRFWQIQAQVLLAGGMASVGDQEGADKLASEAVELSKQIGDRWSEAYSLYWLGDIRLLRGEDLATAQMLFQESLLIYIELKDPWGQAEAKGHLAVVANFQKEFDVARTLFEESLSYMREMGDNWALARSLSGLGDTCLKLGDLNRAKIHYKESLTHWNKLGNLSGIQMCLAALARIAAQEKQLEAAATFYGAAPDPVHIFGILLAHTGNSGYHKLFEDLKTRMDKDVWQKAFQTGKKMSLEDVLAYAANY